MKNIGTLDKEIIEPIFGKLVTNEIILTNERANHIKNNHPNDYEMYIEDLSHYIKDPHYILQDVKNDNTIFLIKKIEKINLNIIIKLAIETLDPEKKNSIMTFYRIRDKNVNKLIQRNRIICNNE